MKFYMNSMGSLSNWSRQKSGAAVDGNYENKKYTLTDCHAHLLCFDNFPRVYPNYLSNASIFFTFCFWAFYLCQYYVKLIIVSKATISKAGGLLTIFDLDRGTWQVCPLSSLLLAMAIEPLAVFIGSSQVLPQKVFKYGEVHEKIMLYADYTRHHLLLSPGGYGD